jgi:hypothetical protein
LHAAAGDVDIWMRGVGALVTFDFLTSVDAANPSGQGPRGYDIRRFVSLGTQLGLEDFVSKSLGGVRPLFGLPRSIKSWINPKGTGDYASPATSQACTNSVQGDLLNT